MSPWTLFLLIKLDGVREFLYFFSVPSFIGIIGFGLFWVVCKIVPSTYKQPDDWGNIPSKERIQDCNAKCKQYRKSAITGLKYCIPIFLIFNVIYTCLPSTKEMAVIYVLPKIINNKQVQEIPKKFLKLADDWIEELSPEKKEK